MFILTPLDGEASFSVLLSCTYQKGSEESEEGDEKGAEASGE